MENIDDFAYSSFSFVWVDRCLFAWRKKMFQLRLCICCWFSIIADSQKKQKVTICYPFWLCIWARLLTKHKPITYFGYSYFLLKRSVHVNFGLRKSTVVYSIQRTHCLFILIWYVSFSLKSVFYLSCKYFHCSVHTSSCCPSCAHIDWIDSFLDQIQLHTWVISCILQSSELFFSLLESFCCNLSIRSCNACSVSIYRERKITMTNSPVWAVNLWQIMIVIIAPNTELGCLKRKVSASDPDQVDMM